MALGAGVSIGASPVSAHGLSPNLSGYERASQTAQQLDNPVPVEAATTQYSTTEAEPDGSFSTTFSAVPTNVRRGNDWVAADATLQVGDEGLLVPKATAHAVELSNGGAGALATLHNGSDAVALSWPTALPKPVMSGPTATYADVLPGVDLAVTADVQGAVSEVLVVKDAVAARNPALDQLRLQTKSTTGVNFSEDAANNVTVTDRSGGEIFHAEAPAMWDSSDHSGTTSPTPEPADGAQQVPVDVGLANNAITLTPDQSMLDDPDTTFPVFIDPALVPSTTKDANGWDWAQEAFPSTSHWKSTSQGKPAVGYQGWTAGSYGRNRSYWQYDVGSITQSDSVVVTNAYVRTESTDSGPYDCDDTYLFNLYNVGHITSSTSWDDQPEGGTKYDSQRVAGSSNDNGCPNRYTNFSVTGSLKNDGDGIVTYRLAAEDERNKNYYKRFEGTDTTLTITYDHAPNTPTTLTTSPRPINGASSTDCTKTPAGWIGKSTTNVTFSTRVSDPDTAYNQSIRADLHLWDKGGDGADPTPAEAVALDSTYSRSSSAAPPSGGTVTRAVPASLLKNGHMYGWDMWGYDGYMRSQDSSVHCYFWVDTSAPGAVTVAKNDFSTGEKTIGQSGNITVTSTDPIPSGAKYSGIDHFNYSVTSADSLDNDGGTTIASGISYSGSKATANIKLTPTTWGTNYLFVSAVDAAGNQVATPLTFKYYVRDDPNAKVNPGDVNGDAHPDLLAENNNGNLDLFPTAPTINAEDKVLASPGSEAPDGASWSNTLIGHRSSINGSTSGARVDDLWALKKGSSPLFTYTNNLNNGGLLGSGNSNAFYSANHRSAVFKPACTYDTTVCGSAYAADWSATTQLMAPGDVDGDGFGDLITVENDALWFFHGTATTGQLTDPRRIGANGWNAWRIVSPGDASGPTSTPSSCTADKSPRTPDIWAFSSAADGGLRQYNLSVANYGCGIDSSNPDRHLDTITVTKDITDKATTGWGTSSRVLAASPGNADRDPDGKPDLYTVINASTGPRQLWANYATSLTTEGPALSTHQQPNAGTDIDWSAYSALS